MISSVGGVRQVWFVCMSRINCSASCASCFQTLTSVWSLRWAALRNATDRVPAWLTNWWTDWLIDYWLTVCLIDWLTDGLTEWMPEWLTDCSTLWQGSEKTRWLMSCVAGVSAANAESATDLCSVQVHLVLVQYADSVSLSHYACLSVPALHLLLSHRCVVDQRLGCVWVRCALMYYILHSVIELQLICLSCCLTYLVWYHLGDVAAFTNADLVALCIALHHVVCSDPDICCHFSGGGHWENANGTSTARLFRYHIDMDICCPFCLWSLQSSTAVFINLYSSLQQSTVMDVNLYSNLQQSVLIFCSNLH